MTSRDLFSLRQAITSAETRLNAKIAYRWWMRDRVRAEALRDRDTYTVTVIKPIYNILAATTAAVTEEADNDDDDCCISDIAVVNGDHASSSSVNSSNIFT